MCVVTISRGSFSGGKLLAELLAARLGYRSIDLDAIIERAALCGMSRDALRDALEKVPTFLDRFTHTKYVYLTLIRAALVEELQDGRAVYHGNAGHLLLRDVTGVLRARIIAPLEFRLAMAMGRLKLNRPEAQAYIRRVDADRRRWTRYLYGVDWADPSLYDIVLNLEQLDLPEACAAIETMLQQECFEFTPQCRAAMHDFGLACRVQASLALDPLTTHLEVEVTARRGSVRVTGRLAGIEDSEEVERVVSAVAGVMEFDREGLVPPIYV